VILSDRELWDLHDSTQGEDGPFVYPWNPDNVQPASIDLTLGSSFVVWVREFVHDIVFHRQEQRTAQFIDLKPGEFVLGTTIEEVSIPTDLVGQVSGKSTWARRGLIVENAGYIDPGFRGQITLELKNVGHESIRLTAGDPICQLVMMQLTSPAERPYGSEGLGSHYMHQRGATPARD